MPRWIDHPVGSGVTSKELFAYLVIVHAFLSSAGFN